MNQSQPSWCIDALELLGKYKCVYLLKGRKDQQREGSSNINVCVDVVALKNSLLTFYIICRRDRVQELNFESIQQLGGGKCILAERMLTELAYKINRAPKFGA